MTAEAFDPTTTTVEELAAYSRKVRRARGIAAIAGALAGLVGHGSPCVFCRNGWA